MDHRAFIASLKPEQRIALTAKSDGAGLLRLATHAGAILLLGGLIVARVPFWPLLVLPQGILVIFLFTLLHETVHRTAFASTWLNNACEYVCGFLILVPVEWFRCFHFAHHRHTQDPDNDPELATRKPGTPWQYALHVSGLPVWRSQVQTLVVNALGRCHEGFVPAGMHARVVLEARVMVAGYAVIAGCSVYAGSDVLLHVWVIPALLGQPFLRLYLLAEHGRCPFVADMLENSRTTFTNRAMRWLAWNMPYHAEHHSFPAVPFHRLPQLHALIGSHLKQTENGYVRFNRRYVAALRE